MSKADDKILEKAKKRFKICEDYYSSEYQRGREDLDFLMGEQWDNSIRSKRQLEGRPCLTENRLLSHAHQVINDIRQSRPAINVIPVDNNSDVETAKILRGIIRNIENNSGADNIYDTGAWNALASGYGWLRINTKFSDNESFNQEIELIRVPDFESVMIDPNDKTMDGSTSEYGFVFVDMARDVFEETYPDADPVNFADYSKDNSWCRENSVRVCEYFYKEYETKTLYMKDDGTVSEDAEGAIDQRDVRVPSVKWCKITAAEILEKTDWLGQYIPLVPVYGEEVWQDGRRKSYSLITQGKDPQRRYNYWLTASTEIIALQPKMPFVGMKGQFATNGDKWAQANNETYSYLEFDAVQMPDGSYYAQAPQRQPAPMGSPAMFQEMLAAADGIKASLGMFNPSLGQEADAKSGKAILAQQAQGNNATFHFVDNLQSSIRHVGRILVDLIPKVITGPQIIRIIGEDDKKLMVPVNQASVKTEDGYAPIQPNQVADEFFDLNLGKYDVVATVGASYATKRLETVNVLQSIIQALPEAAGVVGDILIKNLDIAEADIIVERLKKLNPALADDAEDPRAAQLQQAEQALQAMQQQLMQMDQALQQKREKDQAEIGSEIAKNQAAIEKTQADIRKTEAETVKIMAEIQAAQVQGAGLTPEAVQQIIQTIAQVEAQSRDTADAVELILSHEESKQATSQPEQTEMIPPEEIN